MKNEIDVIITEIKELFKNDFSGHDAEHSIRVYNTAMKIAATEVCDKRLVAIAALLHDADDFKLFPNEDYQNARSILSHAGIDEDMAEKVIGIIKQVSFKGADSEVPDTIEGQIVQDADRLDAMGAIGIARAFAYGGANGRTMYDPNILPLDNPGKEEYQHNIGPTVNHFYEKLFKLKDMMNTSYAKSKAEARDKFMHAYLDEFLKEWEEV